MPQRSSPSLRALQAFEAAARTGSFAAAAEELFVSPAAISQLVRSLETQMGRRLFWRANRGIALTEAGLEILPRLAAAFEEIRGVGRQLSGTAGRVRLTVSVPPSTATGWLAPQIAGFIEQAGPVDLSLRGEEDPVDLDRDHIDLRMSFGPLHYLTHETEELGTDAAYPVCSPNFLERHGPYPAARDLLGAPLIHTDWGRASATFPSWRDMLDPDDDASSRTIARGITANSSHAAIDLAVSGLGIALGQGMFVARMIASGQLVRPVPDKLRLSQPYCLTIRRRSALRPAVQLFRNWLIDRLEENFSALSRQV